jgi:hypothetical protein
MVYSTLTKVSHCVTSNLMTGNTKGDAFSYRPTTEHEKLLNELVEATKHKKARFLDLALEKILPELEKRYAPELADHRKKLAALNEPTAPYKVNSDAGGGNPLPESVAAIASIATGVHAAAPSGKPAPNRPKKPVAYRRPSHKKSVSK